MAVPRARESENDRQAEQRETPNSTSISDMTPTGVVVLITGERWCITIDTDRTLGRIAPVLVRLPAQ